MGFIGIFVRTKKGGRLKGIKAPAKKGDVNGITWRLNSTVSPIIIYHIVACQAVFKVASGLGRYADEFRLHLFPAAFDSCHHLIEPRYGFSRHIREHVFLRGAQVPGTGPGAAQAGQAAACGTAVATDPFRRTAELGCSGFKAAQVHEDQVFEIKPYRGHMAAGCLAGGAGPVAQAVKHRKECFQAASQVPGCFPGGIKRSAMPGTEVQQG